MDLQIIIALGSYTAIALGSYIIIALREGLVVMIKPIKEDTIQRMRWLFLILTILWLVACHGIARNHLHPYTKSFELYTP